MQQRKRLKLQIAYKLVFGCNVSQGAGEQAQLVKCMLWSQGLVFRSEAPTSNAGSNTGHLCSQDSGTHRERVPRLPQSSQLMTSKVYPLLFGEPGDRALLCSPR